MTTNRTSMAVKEVLQKETTSIKKLAIAAKYKRMEEELYRDLKSWQARAANGDSAALLAAARVEGTLAYDPLAE